MIGPASTVNVGLAGSAEAITRGQARFDRAAQAVVDDSLTSANALGDAATLNAAGGIATDDGAAGGNQIQDIASLNSESLLNQMLFGVFSRQADQQKTLMDLVRPTE
jgi:hypothetical protein